MKAATSPSAIKVQSALGDRFQVLEFDESTRTAADAAAAIGCTVAQIAKSLVFRSNRTNRAVLVIASGASRVDEQRVATLIERELALISELNYEPYFLTVHDIVKWATDQGILCQGRGSAANSSVCF